MEQFFRGTVRFVFLAAYGAFLFASVRHIAFFFASFEPSGSDTIGSYWLAISIDVTALVLTIGVMFFSKSMSIPSAIFIWFFIVCLTAFSWIVNWEYAAHFQSVNLTNNPMLTMLNPVLASSFAFLNLAYSIVSEVFTSRQDSLAVLQAKVTRLEEEKELRKRLREAQKGEGFIQQLKEKAIEVKQAASEVFVNDGVLPPDVVNEDENVHEGRTTDPLPVDESEAMSSDISTSLPVESNIVSNTEYVTEEMPKVTPMRPSKKPVNIARAKQKVTKLLAKYPDATQSIIAQKAGVSRGYVSQVRKELATVQ